MKVGPQERDTELCEASAFSMANDCNHLPSVSNSSCDPKMYVSWLQALPQLLGTLDKKPTVWSQRAGQSKGPVLPVDALGSEISKGFQRQESQLAM